MCASYFHGHEPTDRVFHHCSAISPRLPPLFVTATHGRWWFAACLLADTNLFSPIGRIIPSSMSLSTGLNSIDRVPVPVYQKTTHDVFSVPCRRQRSTLWKSRGLGTSRNRRRNDARRSPRNSEQRKSNKTALAKKRRGREDAMKTIFGTRALVAATLSLPIVSAWPPRSGAISTGP